MKSNVEILHADHNAVDRATSFTLFLRPPVELAVRLYKEGKYKKVATVEGVDLNNAFHKTNHIDEAWWANSGVVAEPGRHRSTSCGDIMIANTPTGQRRAYLCSGIGFEEFDLPENNVIKITDKAGRTVIDHIKPSSL